MNQTQITIWLNVNAEDLSAFSCAGLASVGGYLHNSSVKLVMNSREMVPRMSLGTPLLELP